MKKPFSFLLLFVFASPLYVSAGKSGPWKLTGLDFYYSGYSVNAASAFTPTSYHALDKAYANGDRERINFNPLLLRSTYGKPFYHRHGFHADLVFSNYFSRRFLQSQDVRLGLSSSHVPESTVSSDINYFGVEGYDRGDTSYFYSLRYAHAENALSFNISYLLNFRLSNTVAAYGGGHLMLSPFQAVRVNYTYKNVMTRRTPDSTIVLRVYDEYGVNHVNTKSSVTAGFILGIKFNMDCHWNMFVEYQRLYRRMGFKDDVVLTDKGNSLQVGFRYKLGRIRDDDDPAGEPEKKIFW